MSVPKLLIKPSAFKAGNILAQIPTDGTFNLSFSRSGVGTRIDQNSKIKEVASDVCRLDYSQNGCPKWLLEPQSSNLFTYSDDLTNAAWSTLNASVVGSLLSDDSTNGIHRVLRGEPVTSGEYTLYFDVAAGTLDFCRIFENNGSGKSAYFNLSNGTIVSQVSGSNAFIEDYKTFYRCGITFNGDDVAGVNANLQISTSEDGLSDSYVGGSGNINIFRGQLEKSSSPTSFIKTEASQVTRLADVFPSQSVAEYTDTTNGYLSIVIDAESLQRKNSGLAVQLGGSGGRVYLYNVGLDSQFINAVVQSTNGSTNGYLSTQRLNKFLFNWSPTNVDIWCNGVKVLSTILDFELTNQDLYIGGDSRKFRMGEISLGDKTLTETEATEKSTL
jgi:hypothetical protein